jgi:hypothetical protein
VVETGIISALANAAIPDGKGFSSPGWIEQVAKAEAILSTEPSPNL